jgi:hypothetical protein
VFRLVSFWYLCTVDCLGTEPFAVFAVTDKKFQRDSSRLKKKNLDAKEKKDMRKRKVENFLKEQRLAQIELGMVRHCLWLIAFAEDLVSGFFVSRRSFVFFSLNELPKRFL